MQTTDRIREKAKSSITIQTATNISLRAITSSSKAPVISNNNSSFLRLSNILWRTITLTLRNSDAYISRLIKEGKCFNCKRKRCTLLNCPEKAKVLAIIDILDVDDIGNID